MRKNLLGVVENHHHHHHRHPELGHQKEQPIFAQTLSNTKRSSQSSISCTEFEKRSHTWERKFVCEF